MSISVVDLSQYIYIYIYARTHARMTHVSTCPHARTHARTHICILRCNNRRGGFVPIVARGGKFGERKAVVDVASTFFARHPRSKTLLKRMQTSGTSTCAANSNDSTRFCRASE